MMNTYWIEQFTKNIIIRSTSQKEVSDEIKKTFFYSQLG